MGNLNWTTRRKLFVSLTVLAIVFIIAAVAQFTGKDTRQNPHAATRDLNVPRGPRAVFGGEPRSEPMTTSATDRTEAEAATRARTVPPEPTTERASIDRFLDRWTDTLAKGDVETHSDLYAPTVTRFFNQRNVSKNAVRKVKSQMLVLYPTVNRYEISDVKVESNTGSEAVVSFRKEWDMNGKRRFAGAERQRLRLRRLGGDWKIVGEEETKVYWTKRG
jgi:hypothetical protein